MEYIISLAFPQRYFTKMLGFFPDLIQPHFLPKVNPISKSHCGSYFGNLLTHFIEDSLKFMLAIFFFLWYTLRAVGKTAAKVMPDGGLWG